MRRQRQAPVGSQQERSRQAPGTTSPAVLHPAARTPQCSARTQHAVQDVDGEPSSAAGEGDTTTQPTAQSPRIQDHSTPFVSTAVCCSESPAGRAEEAARLPALGALTKTRRPELAQTAKDTHAEAGVLDEPSAHRAAVESATLLTTAGALLTPSATRSTPCSAHKPTTTGASPSLAHPCPKKIGALLENRSMLGGCCTVDCARGCAWSCPTLACR